MDNQQHSLAESIMNEIDQKDLKIKPKFYFVIGSLVLTMSATVFFVLSVLLTDALIYRVKTYRHYEYLLFGQPGLRAFFAAFPWGLLILAVAGTLIGIYLVRRYESTYRFQLTSLALFASISILASGLILEQIDATKPLHATPTGFFLFGENTSGKYWVTGVIIQSSENQLLLQTSDQEEIVVTNVPQGTNLESGTIIRVVGEWQAENVFQAYGVKIAPNLPTPAYRPHNHHGPVRVFLIRP